MTMDRFHRPPRPSTPAEAPWTEAELLHADLQELIQLLRGFSLGAPAPPAPGGPIEVIVQPGAPAPAASAAPTVHERIFRATGGSASAIMVNGANWETDMWQGWELEIVEGSGVGQFRRIIFNTRDKITPRKNFDSDPDNTSVFVLRPRYPMDNPNSFATLTKIVTLAATPEQLTTPTDALTVPNGWPILLMALADNTDDVFFATSSDNLQAQATCFDRLEPGKSIPLYLTKTDLIWIKVLVDGEGVSAYVPQWVADS